MCPVELSSFVDQTNITVTEMFGPVELSSGHEWRYSLLNCDILRNCKSGRSFREVTEEEAIYETKEDERISGWWMNSGFNDDLHPNLRLALSRESVQESSLHCRGCIEFSKLLVNSVIVSNRQINAKTEVTRKMWKEDTLVMTLLLWQKVCRCSGSVQVYKTPQGVACTVFFNLVPCSVSYA